MKNIILSRSDLFQVPNTEQPSKPHRRNPFLTFTSPRQGPPVIVASSHVAVSSGAIRGY
ncbi:hypothetical protein PIB30_007001, partial [Stylosanthes scabra]|nr:hypothetical protein [Stylosanthes scabra]